MPKISQIHDLLCQAEVRILQKITLKSLLGFRSYTDAKIRFLRNDVYFIGYTSYQTRTR